MLVRTLNSSHEPRPNYETIILSQLLWVHNWSYAGGDCFDTKWKGGAGILTIDHQLLITCSLRKN